MMALDVGVLNSLTKGSAEDAWRVIINNAVAIASRPLAAGNAPSEVIKRDRETQSPRDRPPPARPAPARKSPSFHSGELLLQRLSRCGVSTGLCKSFKLSRDGPERARVAAPDKPRGCHGPTPEFC